MKKNFLTKEMLLSFAMLSTACFLGGCTDDSATAASVPVQSEQQKESTSAGTTPENTKPEEPPISETMEITSEPVIINKNTADISYDALNDFCYKLFAENMDEENPVLSPVSAYMALSMAGLGAENNTKEEFASVFGDYTDVTAVCGDLMTALPTSSENNIVTLANSAWIDESFPVSESWISDINTMMHSEVFQKDLTASDTMDSMNQWIEENTNGLIDKMLEKPLSTRTGLALFNTIYFKAKWEDSFEQYSVYQDTFYLEDGNELDAELMHKESDMDYLSNDFAQGLIFPYISDEAQDGNFAFVALKPVDENTKVRELYAKLTPSAIKELIANKQNETVNTKLPKFEIEFDQQLNESLMNMGLHDAFDVEKADFSKIAASSDALEGNLYIALVRQKAKIIVDEEGTEAAAATAVMMECGAALPIETPKEVFFDRPFVYMIMDMDREIPLFIGILDSPAA